MNGYKKSILAAIIVLALLVAGAWVDRWYWEHWPMVPLVLHGDKIKITNANREVCQGSMLLYAIEGEKLMEYTGAVVKRQLINSYVITYPASQPPTKPMGHIDVGGHLHVPKMAEVGDWYMRWEVIVPLGPEKYGRKFSIAKNSEPFWVVDCDNDKGEKGDRGPKGDKGEPGKGFWGK